MIFAFAILWNTDFPVVRRANIFMPYIAIISSYGFVRFLRYVNKNKITYMLFIGLFIYSITFVILSQYNFLNDTRHKADRYLNEHFSSKSNIAYTPYARIDSMPHGKSLKNSKEDVDVIVMHEACYSRYWKSFTTPYKIPECCDEVYNCRYQDCILIQYIFSGNSNYQLIKEFKVVHFFPERLLFKHLFGTYDTFLGDMLIFKKTHKD